MHEMDYASLLTILDPQRLRPACSLGGALATLCAYDIKKRMPQAEYLMDVSCYTFGAPRTGELNTTPLPGSV